METTLPMTGVEFWKIKARYLKGISKFKNVSFIAPTIGAIALFLPPKVWNVFNFFEKEQDWEGMSEALYQNPTMIIIILIAVTLVILLNYLAFVRPLKKDLNAKEKIRGVYKVIRIEHLGPKVAKALDGMDTVLHFEKNSPKMEKHLFNKSSKPELLDAKEIIVERAKHSGLVFLEEIVKYRQSLI